MNASLKGLLIAVSLGAPVLVHAQSAWSTQDYDLYPGDFNGDGLTDMLYIAKDPSHLSGIVLSDGTALNIPLQTWDSAYLGIPWSDGTYNIVVADFNGDGKADIFLQRTKPGDHYLLLTGEGGISAISQTVPNDAAGLTWSADRHHLVAGDFNGDGKADLFFQPTDSRGLSAVVLADLNGQFTAKVPDQSWNDGYAGLYWATSESVVYAGDFNGDGLWDLLVQALPISGTGPGTPLPAQFIPNSNGVSLVQASKQIFSLEGVQAWSQNGFSANWSPLASSVIVGDFNADGRSDVLLQGLTAQDLSYIVYGHAPGAIFTEASVLGGDALPTANAYLPLVGRFTSDKGYGLYLQPTAPTLPNLMARVAGTSLVITQADGSTSAPVPSTAAPAPTIAAPAALPAAAPTPAGGAAAPAALAVTSMGRTPGQFTVSPTGASTYQIPIWMPAGPRGIQPSLAIVYSSQSGDGIMGPGWNLAGLSAITRCNKTYAQDTTGAPVALVTADGYCFNGNRLRLTAGTYGTDGSTYQTEVADFSLVSANGTSGQGPVAFIVKGKDGLTYEYGNTTDSRILYGTAAGVWLLDKVSDRSGNNYVVTYGTGAAGSAAVGVPLTISYTLASPIPFQYRYTIAFAYGTRLSQVPTTKDPAIVGYVNGTVITNTGLLLSIGVSSITSGSTLLVRKYLLSYGAAVTTTRARLTSVQECGGSAGTDCLSPTNIGYQDGTAGVATTAVTAITGSTTVYATRDFDGDGREDILISGPAVAFASGTGFSAPVSVASGVTGIPAMGDVAGRGKNDILANIGGTYWLYTWNGTAFVGTSTGIAVPANTYRTALIDFNGDGLPDLVMVTRTYNVIGNTVYWNLRVLTQLNTSVGGVPSFSSTQLLGYSTSLNCPILNGCAVDLLTGAEPRSGVRDLDFDGDGRRDLVLNSGDDISGHAIIPLISNGSYFTAGSSLSNDQIVVGFANFNDDRCTDLVAGDAVLISPCNGQAGGVLPVPGGFGVLTTMDWDGDGRTDILVQSGTVFGVYESTATGFSALINTTIPVSTTNAKSVVAMDQNGDGESDLLTWSTTSALLYSHNGAGTPPDLVTSIADGYGVTASPSYVSIAQGSYTKGSGAVYPDEDYIGPQYVTKLVNLTDGISTSGTYSQIYTYTSARQNLQGRGFEGFQSRKVVDSRTSAPVRISYYLNGQNNTSRFPLTGMVYQDDVLQSNGTTVISSDVITNAYSTLDNTTNNQRYFPHVSISATTQYEVGGTQNGLTSSLTTVNFTFDTSGNATTVDTTTKDTDVGSPYATQQWETKTTRNITPNLANWCLGLPTQVQVANTAPSVPNITRTVSYTPDYGNCRENQQVIELSSASYKVTEDVDYDSFGNIWHDTVTGGNNGSGVAMAPRTTITTWGTTGQFPVTITNPLNQVETLGYNYDYGVKTSDKDANNIQISWDYDTFAREKLETRPDNTTTTISYNACASLAGGCQNGDPASGVTAINKLVVIATQYDYSGGPQIRDDWTYMDQFDRTIVTKAKTLTGTYSRVGTQFDVFGNIAKRTEPCDAAGCTVYWTANHYDALNRLIDQTRPNWTQAATVHYQGRTTVYTDPQGMHTTQVATVVGQMGQSLDHNNYRQDFTYDAFGSLLKVQDNSSPVNVLFQAKYAYGVRAFQTETADMDLDVATDLVAPHRHYTYDALGELVNVSDTRNNTVTLDPYDLLGRPTRRVEATASATDLTTTWTWGALAASYNIGRLASVTAVGPQSYAESYSYDSSGRLTNRTIQGNAYDLSYDAHGSLKTITYPATTSNCRVVVQYDYQNGVLKTVTDASNSTYCTPSGTVFWTANGQNPRGEITQETLGNQVVTNRGFDGVTGWLATIQAGANGGTALQNLSYQYDQMGNVTQRRDSNANLTETMCYDNLYRLDHTTSTALCADPPHLKLQMTYDAMGNITSRGDIAGGADWTYSATHKHQVLQAGDANHTYTYDNDGNAVTRNSSGISWTSYNMPLTINAPGEVATFSYGQNHQKWLQQYSGPNGTENTTYLAGLLEKVDTSGGTDWRHYIFAGAEQVAVYSRTSTGTNTVRYTLEDHQGSPSAILPGTANPTSALVNESFEPYGTRRNPATWSGPPVPADVTVINSITRVGYTGQTMLGNMGLIHMNGRAQDSVTGRFLSADPYVTEPDNTQNFNRYGYVYNNPLTYFDPTGYIPVCIDYYAFTPPNNLGSGVGAGLENVPITAKRLPLFTTCIDIDIDGAGGGGLGSGQGGTQGAAQSLRQQVCSSLNSPNSTRGTLQLGVAATGDVGPIAGTAGFGLALDTHGNVAVYGFLGGGTGAGLSGVAGGSVQVSNAYEVSDLSGPFANVSATAGAGAAGTGDGFRGSSLHGWVTGGGATLGPGGGGSAFAGGTYTYLANLINLTNLAKAIFGCKATP